MTPEEKKQKLERLEKLAEQAAILETYSRLTTVAYAGLVGLTMYVRHNFNPADPQSHSSRAVDMLSTFTCTVGVFKMFDSFKNIRKGTAMQKEFIGIQQEISEKLKKKP